MLARRLGLTIVQLGPSGPLDNHESGRMLEGKRGDT